MKKLLLPLLLIISGAIFSQSNFPNYQQFGTPTTLTDIKGAGRGSKGFVVGSYPDTTTANGAGNYIKFYPGAVIFTTDSSTLWLRNKYASAWVKPQAQNFDIISLTFDNDTTGIICFSNGVCDTFNLVNNNVFQTVNNTFGSCNNLLKGGVVTAANPTVNLIFDVTAADYTIACKAYHTNLSQVTLANGNATFPRFDVVIVDTNEVVSVIQGTPDANPQVPQINTSSQLALTIFLVPAGATTAAQLGITQTVIYDQNLGTPTEWNGAAVAWTSDRDNLANPFHLTKCDLVSGSTLSTSKISWTTTDTMRNGQFDVFKFYIRLTDAWNSAQGFDIAFYHGATKVTNSVILQNNSYGFDQTVTGSYQTIAIPMANWVFSDSIFFSVVIKPIATPFSSQAFRLDWIQLQGGINQALGGSSGLYIWNQYSLAQPANWWVAGNTRTEGSPTSPQRIGSGNTFYSGSEKYGQQAIANGVEATVIGAYARGTASGAIAIGSQATGSGIILSQYGTSNSVTNINLGGLGITGTGNSGVGINVAIVGNENVGIGETTTIGASRNVAIGYNAGSNFSNSIALGYTATTTRANELLLSPNTASIEARGMTRNHAGYVLTDSTGNGQYLVLRPTTGNSVTIIDNSHIQVCNGNGNCDTITVGGGVTAQLVFVINDSTIRVCDTLGNCTDVIIPQTFFDRGFFDPNQVSSANTYHITNGKSFSVGRNLTTSPTGVSDIFNFGNGNIILANTVEAFVANHANTVGGSENVVFGRNMVVRGNTNFSAGTDGTISSTSNYSASFGDANDVFCTACLTSGFGNDAYSENGFLMGNDNVLGALSPGGGTANQYTSSWAIGSQIRTTGSNNGTLGYFLQNTGAKAILIGSGFGSTRMVNSVASRIAFGTNSDSATLIIGPAAGTTGTYGATFARGTFSIGSVSNDNTETRILVQNSSFGSPIEYRDASTFLTGITADNGLTASTATNVQLGGTLLHNTDIEASSFRLRINTEFASGVVINNIGAGNALNGYSNGGVTGFFATENSTTNTILPVLELDRYTDGTAADGIGVSIDFSNETASGVISTISNRIISKWTTAANATRTSQLDITGVSAATTQTIMSLAGSGQLTLNQYTTSNFNGGAAADSVLVVTSAGVVKKRNATSFAVITGNNGVTASTSTNLQLGGTLIQNTTINNGGNYFLMDGTLGTAGFATAMFFNYSGTGNAITGDATDGGYGGKFGITDNSVGNTVLAGLAVYHQSAVGVAGSGMGTSLDFRLSTSLNNVNAASGLANRIKSIYTVVTDGAETSQLVFTGKTAGAAQDWLTIGQSGYVKFRPMTVTEAGAIATAEGLMVFVSNTDGTFTSIGPWMYYNGAWHAL